MEINGFSFVHNAIESGYPIIEAIESVMFWVDDLYVVDMQSTDTTRQVLSKMGVNIIDGKWGNMAGETLAEAHKLHCFCSGDIIIHFEADEVYPEKLLSEIVYQIDQGKYNQAVWRLQLEQNFQRCRWYPEKVHRVYPKGTVRKVGHTTDLHKQGSKLYVVPQEYGYLWDITNCFRDNWLNRVYKQAELWNEQPKYRKVSKHNSGVKELPDGLTGSFLSQSHWTWQDTPFDLPANLKPLVGVTKYSESEAYRRLINES